MTNNPNPQTSSSFIQAGSQVEPKAEADLVVATIQEQSPQALLALLDHDSPYVRWQAAESLARVAQTRQAQNEPFWARAMGRSSELDADAMLAKLSQALDTEDVALRTAVVDALGAWQHTACLPYLRTAILDPNDQVRSAAASGLGKCSDVDSTDALLDMAQMDASVWARASAIDALGVLGQANVAPSLRQMLDELDDKAEPQEDASSSDPAVSLLRARLVAALGHLDHSQARSALLRYAEQTDDPSLRWMAARGLECVGGAEALVVLESLVDDETVIFGQSTGDVAQAAISAIKRREQGLTAWLRQTFYRLSRFVRRLTQRKTLHDGGAADGS